MSVINYKKLNDLPIIEEASEATYALVEEGGVAKRISGSMLGGGGGIKTAIIKDSNYDSAIAGVQAASASAEATTYECINMTFEEAYETMAMGEPLSVVGMIAMEGGANIPGLTMFVGTAIGVPCIMIELFAAMDSSSNITIMLYWTADGLSTEAPSR